MQSLKYRYCKGVYVHATQTGKPNTWIVERNYSVKLCHLDLNHATEHHSKQNEVKYLFHISQ